MKLEEKDCFPKLQAVAIVFCEIARMNFNFSQAQERLKQNSITMVAARPRGCSSTMSEPLLAIANDW